MSSVNLGPLWAGTAKTSGFLVSIPDPSDITTWIRKTSSQCGDSVLEDLNKIDRRQFSLYTQGLSSRFLSTERVWKIDLPQPFTSIRVELSAGFSPKQGGWGDLMVYLEMSPSFSNDSWFFAKQATTLTNYLRKHGLLSNHFSDADGNHFINVIRNRVTTHITLGYTSLEARRLVSPDVDDADVDDILIYLENWSLNPLQSFLGLGLFQEVVSYTIDGLYLLSHQPPPDLTLEISPQTELK